MPESELAPESASPEAALYEVVPEQFIAARAALVKRLRSEGHKADAARVAKLRRPPLTAWALNQVARAAPELLVALHQAGSHLRAAMERALEGDASELRPARAEERAAVEAVVADAAARLEDVGHTATDVIRQRLAATLRAAIVDESVAAALGQARLEGDHEAPGFGIDALSGPPPGGEKPPPEPPPKPELDPELDPPSVPHDDEDEAGPGRPEADRGRAARLIERRDEVRREAQRLAAEAAAMCADADRLAAEGEQLSAQAQVLMERSAEARQRGEEALRAAAAQQAEAERLAQELATTGAVTEDD